MDTTPFYALLPTALYRRLKRTAAAENRTMRQLVTEALTQYLDRKAQR